MSAVEAVKRVGRRMLPPRLLSARRLGMAVLEFAQEEWASPVRLSAPDLLVRGYLSDRRWLYPPPVSRADGYLNDIQYRHRTAKMNPLPVQRAFNDKAAFAADLAAHGLGDHLPRELATVSDGVVARLPGSERHRGPVVLKPVAGSGGEGVAVHDDLATALAACPGSGRFLVQERVTGHPYAVALFPEALNTLRIFTIRDTPGATPRVTVIVQRMGRASTAPLDSFSLGGIVSRVDPDTGELSYAVGHVEGRARRTYDRHPDSGARITGAVVAGIDEATDLALRAMAVYPAALHVGWDVAVSDRGPLVIEGNGRRPGARLVQVHGPFALDPSCSEFYRRWGLLPASAGRLTPRG